MSLPCRFRGTPRLRLSRVLFCAAVAVGFPVAAVWAAGDTAAEYNNAGVESYNAQRWADAVANFSKARDLTPENKTVLRNLCNAYQSYANELAKSGDFASAVAQLQQAISFDPGNVQPLIQLGAYYLRLDQASDAIQQLEEAIQLDPQNIDGHDLLGDAYYRDNDLPSALAQWEYVQEIQPGRHGLRAKLEKARREETVENRFGRSGSRHFEISFAQGTGKADLARVLTTLERAYRDVGRKFGGICPPTPIQVIVYTADDFAKATLAGEHVGALYDGKIRVPLKDSTGKLLADAELQRRLFHEYTHVVVRFLTGDNVPWWLNEGLAETFSRDMNSSDTSLLEEAQKNGSLFKLSDLEKGQLDSLDKDKLRIAYCQAHATVRYLWVRFGQASLTTMLTSLSQGTSPQDALAQTYRRSYPLLEKEVAANLGKGAAK